jgi:hypothetical protein
MGEIPTLSDYAIRSDFLVYWTGKDLDQAHEPDWATRPYRAATERTRNRPIVQQYLDRLKNILTYGLWLTEADDELWVQGSAFPIPRTPKACFTELKLSESRRHSIAYGRLGIGVKRPYIVNRHGRPLAYYWRQQGSFHDPLLQACANDLSDKSLLNFFKPMNSGAPLNYDLYSECEWRILFRESLLRDGLLVDPRDPNNDREHGYYLSLSAEQQGKLKFLSPLDGWFALIIYPNLAIKNAAQWDESVGIRDAIKRIKLDNSDHANAVEGGNWPAEMDLNSLRHF